MEINKLTGADVKSAKKRQRIATQRWRADFTSPPRQAEAGCGVGQTKTHTVENFPRIEPKHLPWLCQKIELYRGNPLTGLAMKLMALSFVRSESLLFAEWSEYFPSFVLVVC